MPKTREPLAHNLPMACPHCTNGAVSLLVLSLSLVTVRCTKCTHAWSLKIDRLPELARAPLAAWCSFDPPL